MGAQGFNKGAQGSVARGCLCGVFIDDENYSVAGPVDRIIPADVKIPGCPPKPGAIIEGIIKVLRMK
ncbi:MAG: F(420)H(2) dehydrogenase subunit B [Methanocella sp. PtaU1.Bin125]|nr:MAG: F(420)H(2) dehydrogenase subunit B [Methanocella sp. PtaU1.Bin125]